MELMAHETETLKRLEGLNRVGIFHDQGLGKTFTGAEKMKELGASVNLIVCQKSKIEDWKDHIQSYYAYDPGFVYDLTNEKELTGFMEHAKAAEESNIENCFGIINYELAFRRSELLNLRDFTLMLDESSLIQNERAKRSKFVLKLGNYAANVILLSGTPTGGKYERLWSQLHLLGWDISKKTYWNQYVTVEYLDTMGGRSIPIVKGYKNVERLKRKMRAYGCDFLKTENVLDLPEQTFQTIHVKTSDKYRQFRKNSIVNFGGLELVGDTTLTKMLYERQLCGMYSKDKLEAFTDLLESTDDRIIVFYNFDLELNHIKSMCQRLEKPVSVVNGKEKNLVNYDTEPNSVTLIQYQAGAMGLNLQKANKMIFYTPPLSSELYEQAKKRIHRIGQKKPCFYYLLTCKNSIEEKIYKTLAKRKDYTEKLFENERV